VFAHVFRRCTPGEPLVGPLGRVAGCPGWGSVVFVYVCRRAAGKPLVGPLGRMAGY